MIMSKQDNNKQDKNVQNNQPPQDEQQSNTKKYFWIAVVCFALGILFFGLSFTILGTYALFGSMILELAAISFLNGQKRYNYFLACKILRIASYAVMLVGVAMVLGLIGYKLS
jgi:hypothetical protein